MSNSLRIAIAGYGKMGKEVEKSALEHGHEISFRISSANAKDLMLVEPSNTDVVIEFSTPEAAYQNVLTLLQKKLPVVCGTTGWDARLRFVKLFAQSNECSFLHSTNFSVGVNLFMAIQEFAARRLHLLEQYWPAIHEVHHEHKKDAPSGTAITLAEQLLKSWPSLDGWVHDQQEDKKLTVSSERTGEVPGTHVINFSSEADSITLIHTAHNREGFASGAVLAAEFLIGKSGIFSMKEVLGL